MSRVVRKPAFCICENKDADQLRGNRETYQRLCFRYIHSLYKKKRKPYIIFDYWSPIEAKLLKLAGYLDFYVFYQQVEIRNVNGFFTTCFLSPCKGTHKTKSHNTQYVMISHRMI